MKTKKSDPQTSAKIQITLFTFFILILTILIQI